ncbi:hypothetical protein [Thiomonas sp. FB-Cd]|uniref:hypothetical protein n=1 Tax=Thiomonas sp. FB-Cd TaxID=1158292 RepID=UPI0009E043ED|nr:hypothetical protein [Thiomonas sp. FB-Cd]
MTNDVTTHRGFGVVLDPLQFAAELASLKQRPQYQGRALYVQLPDAIARIFESPLVPIHHSLAISGGAALPVAVATFQAAGTQVVCLVPLATEEARDWLVESVDEQRRIYLAATVDERKQVVVMRAETPVRDVRDPTWLALKKHLGEWRSHDRAAEVMDMLEVLRFVEHAAESEVAGFTVQERWIFVCVPHHQDGVGVCGSEGAGAAQATSKGVPVVH